MSEDWVVGALGIAAIISVTIIITSYLKFLRNSLRENMKNGRTDESGDD